MNKSSAPNAYTLTKPNPHKNKCEHCICLLSSIILVTRTESKTSAIVSSASIAYNNRLILFVETAVSTPPPDTINHQQGIPTPNLCIRLLKDLNTCANSPQPSDYCYELIQGKTND